MKSVSERYLKDPYFKAIVDYLHSLLVKAEFTPTEMREAAMLAQIKYEEYNTRPVVFTRYETMKDLEEAIKNTSDYCRGRK